MSHTDPHDSAQTKLSLINMTRMIPGHRQKYIIYFFRVKKSEKNLLNLETELTIFVSECCVSYMLDFVTNNTFILLAKLYDFMLHESQGVFYVFYVMVCERNIYVLFYHS